MLLSLRLPVFSTYTQETEKQRVHSKPDLKEGSGRCDTRQICGGSQLWAGSGIQRCSAPWHTTVYGDAGGVWAPWNLPSDIILPQENNELVWGLADVDIFSERTLLGRLCIPQSSLTWSSGLLFAISHSPKVSLSDVQSILGSKLSLDKLKLLI